MARQRSRPIFNTSLSESGDKLILLLAFFAGVGGLLVIKGYYADPLTAAFFAAAVLLCYVALAWGVSGEQIEPEVIGDNVYYLGFLFTLTSLAMTLHGILDADLTEDLMQSIVAGFGIALSSTIVGVFLRVLMTQFRVDLVARDRAARVTLNRAVREMRTELSDSAGEMKRFSIELTQLMREANDRILKDAETGYAEMVQSGKDAADAYARVLQESVAARSAALMDEVRRDLAASFTALTNEAESASTRLNAAMKRYETQALEHSNELSAARKRSAEDLAKAQENAADIYSGVAALASELPARTQDLATHVKNAAESLKAATDALSADLAQTLAARTTRLEELGAMRTTADQAARDVDATITQLSTATERLGRNAADLRTAAVHLGPAA